MSASFLKNYMDLDEFLAVKDLCAGLSRTESDYSEDDMDQDFVNYIEKEDAPSEFGLSPHFDANDSSLASPSTGSTSDEGRGDSICSSSENTTSSCSCESPTVSEKNVTAPRKRKRKSPNSCSEKEKGSTRKRRRKTTNGTVKETTEGGDNPEKQKTANPVPRISRKSVDDSIKDEKYWERRKKNNQAAKRSRDLKRQKEINVKERAASLEAENKQLRDEVKKLKDYLNKLGDKID